MKSKPAKSKFLPFAIVILVVAVVLIAGKLISSGSLFSSILNSKNPITIDPSTMEMSLAESHTFTSYATVSTGTIPVKSYWSLKADPKAKKVEAPVIDYTKTPTDATSIISNLKSNGGVFLEGCTASETCILHSGTVATDVTLVATNGDGTAEVPVHITADLPANPFTDTVPDWAQAMAYSLHEKGIFNGYADGSFGADKILTRGQAVTLYYNLTKSYGVDADKFIENKDCNVVSMKPDHYAYKAVCYAFYAGWLKDLDMWNGFQPDAPILRNEVALITSNVAGDKSADKYFNLYVPDSEYKIAFTDEYLIYRAKAIFKDVLETTKYPKAIAVVDLDGIMTGNIIDGKWYFKPEAKLNRAEMAKILGSFISLIQQIYGAY